MITADRTVGFEFFCRSAYGSFFKNSAILGAHVKIIIIFMCAHSKIDRGLTLTEIMYAILKSL